MMLLGKSYQIQVLGLLLLLIFSTLAFGAVERWAYSISQLLIFSLASLVILRALIKGERITLGGGMGFILLLFSLIPILQLIPLSSSILRNLSPATYQLLHTLERTNAGDFHPISIYPFATEESFFFLLSLFFIFFLFKNSLKDEIKRERFALLLILFISFFSLFAIVEKLTWNGKLYWVRALKEEGDPFGSFVNRNNAVCFLTAGFFLALGYYLEKKNEGKGILLFLLPSMVGGAILYSSSKGGILNFILSLSIFLGLFIRKTRRSWKGFLPTLVLLILFLLLLLSPQKINPVLEKIHLPYLKELTDFTRINLWRDALSIPLDFPLIGTGGGTFSRIFTKYKRVPEELLFEHAENEYLEVAVEGGMLAVTLTFFLFLLFGKRLKENIQKARGSLTFLRLGAVVGVLSLGIHSLFDFALEIPAIAYFAVAVLFFATAPEGERAENRGKRNIPLSIIFISLSLLGIYWGASGVLLTENLKQEELRIAREIHYSPKPPLRERGNSGYLLALADYASSLANERGGQIELTLLEEAVKADPVNFELYLRLGNAYATRGREKEAVASFEKALLLNPRSSRVHYILGMWLIGRDYEEGVKHLREAISLYPKYLELILSYLLAKGIPPERIVDTLPQKKDILIAASNILIKRNEEEASALCLARAIKIVEEKGEKEKAIKYRLRLSRLLTKRGDYAKALAEVEKVLSLNPAEPNAHYQRGIIYLRMRRYQEAVSSFEKAVALSKGNKDFLIGLGIGYYSLKDYHQAEGVFLSAQEMGKRDDPITHLWLARVYLKRGERDKALREYKKLLTLDPGNKEAKKWIARLEKK
ncbi:MAG: tetratricopeptide repeat protein [Acidobacteria bacterium]|nr:tetratricopeptide repeat protein [Acidobacteriota bacterium]